MCRGRKRKGFGIDWASLGYKRSKAGWLLVVGEGESKGGVMNEYLDG